MSDKSKSPSRPKRRGMSAVLLEFAEHFAAEADIPRLGRRHAGTTTALVTLAMLAWNTALRPPERRAEFLDRGLTFFPPGAREKFRPLALRMIEHKDATHARDRRELRDCAVSFEGGAVRLRVRLQPTS